MPRAKVSDPTAGEAMAGPLLALIDELVRDLRPDGPPATLNLDSALDRDLGLDSLARTELLLRIERRFGMTLADEALTVDTPRELLAALLAAGGAARPLPPSALRYRPQGTVAATPAEAATLTDVLDWHVQRHPERKHIFFYDDSDARDESLSYADLQQNAQALVAGLQNRGVHVGQSVAIMLPTGREYFLSFYGVMLAGAVPVPIYPPARPAQLAEHLRRHRRILHNAGATLLITTAQAKTLAHLLQAQLPAMRHVCSVEELATGAGEGLRRSMHGQDVAFLQYTSGSTGDPKGVVLTHANLLANIRAMGQRIEASSADVFVSWLPLYHDMGLIGAWLGSLYHACPLVVMSPLSFLARPARWLWAIHRYHGSLSTAPNFGYELALRKIDDCDIQGLDLSTWRMAFNGAEPVSPETVERFSRRFARCGLRAEALAPVYGLAECSVGLAIPPPGRGPLIDRVRREVFTRTGRAEPAPASDPRALRFIACGPPLPGHQIRIVDAAGREVPERQEGLLEFTGPSATGAYLNNPQATRELCRDGWLNSGDRAYIAGGDVYITGRSKDIIIRGGRNFYPYELEAELGELDGIRKGCVAVIASTATDSGAECLTVVAETRETTPAALAALRRKINAISVDLLGIPPDDVQLVPPHTLLKTSSGKLRRGAIRELYEHHSLGQSSARWPLGRIIAFDLIPALRRRWRRCAELAFAAYAWAAFVLLVTGGWCAAVALPRADWRWGTVRHLTRLLGHLTATRLSVQGLENLPRAAPCILVANHSSYLDAFVLSAAVPKRFSYVAKRELGRFFTVRVLLQRLETLLVERYDLQRSQAEEQRLIQAAQAGRSLAFFPEGTLQRMPGLLPFHMGAFIAAAKADLPIIPVAIRGTRSMLRAGSWFPRRGQIKVVVTPAIVPQGKDWKAALELRNEARESLLHYCGEPDLAREAPSMY